MVAKWLSELQVFLYLMQEEEIGARRAEHTAFIPFARKGKNIHRRPTS